jgi:hypothetical protein
MNQFTCKGVKQINNQISLNMTFTFTIRISQPFSSAQEFQMGNFQKYWLQNVGQDFLVLDFFSRAEDFESWRKGPSKSGEKCYHRKVHMYEFLIKSQLSLACFTDMSRHERSEETSLHIRWHYYCPMKMAIRRPWKL